MKEKKKTAGIIIFIISFLAFTGFIGMAIAPQGDSTESNGLRLEHIEETDGFADQPKLIMAEVSSQQSDSVSVKLHYYRNDEFSTIVMKNLPGTDYFGAEIPADKLGERNYYFIEAMDGAENKVVLPETADDSFDSEYDYYKARFEGKATFILLLFHIVLMIAAFFLLLHALYYAMNYLAVEERGDAIVRSVNLGILTFFITGFPIGCIIEKQVLGNYWEGIPFGWDVTDSKTLIIMIIWLILMYLKKKDKVSMRGYSWWVIINTIITIGLFLLPHSL